MYVLVKLALGSGWPIDKLVSPAVMAVDYIRVYKDKALPESRTLLETTR